MNSNTATSTKANGLLEQIDRRDPRQVEIGLMLLRQREKRKREADTKPKRGAAR